MAKIRSNVKHQGIEIPATYDRIKSLSFEFTDDRQAVKVKATMASYADESNLATHDGPFATINIENGVRLAGRYFVISNDGKFYDVHSGTFESVGTEFATEEAAIECVQANELNNGCQVSEGTYSNAEFEALIDPIKAWAYINAIALDERYEGATDDETLMAPQ
jgi:hypothetical protein